MNRRGLQGCTEEPDELVAHVRVRGGPGWETTGPTRKPMPVDRRGRIEARGRARLTLCRYRAKGSLAVLSG